MELEQPLMPLVVRKHQVELKDLERKGQQVRLVLEEALRILQQELGGGGGWFGGGSGDGAGTAPAGGSGWTFTETSFNAGHTSSVNTGGTWLLSTDYFLDASSTLSGNQSIPTHDGTSTMIGNTGHGYAKITFLVANPNERVESQPEAEEPNLEPDVDSESDRDANVDNGEFTEDGEKIDMLEIDSDDGYTEVQEDTTEEYAIKPEVRHVRSARVIRYIRT